MSKRDISQYTVVQLLSHVWLFETPWAAVYQAPLSSAVSQRLLSQWCYLTISSSATPFLFCLQSFPASRSFPVSWLVSGGQSIGTSVSVLPMNIQDWFHLGLTGLISLMSKGLLESRLQHHNLKPSVLWHYAFFVVQLSHPYMITGKTIGLTMWTFVGKVMSLLFKYTVYVCHTFPFKEQASFIFMAAVMAWSDFWSPSISQYMQ